MTYKNIRILIFFLLLFSPASLMAADITTGLIGWWKLDEPAAGNATDSSGNGRTCSDAGNTNTTVSDLTCPRGVCRRFYETPSGYLDCGTAALGVTDQITVAGWVYVPSDNESRLITKHENNDYGWLLARYRDSDSVEWRISTDGDNWQGGQTQNNSFPLNTWLHIAGTYDGSYMRVYINGVENTSGDLPVALSGNINDNDQPLSINCDGYLDVPLDIHLDDLRIYNRALNTSDIAALYRSTYRTILRNATIRNARIN